jgi:hypothetical protein
MIRLQRTQVNGKEITVGVDTTDGSALYHSSEFTIQEPSIRILIKTLSLMDRNKTIELSEKFGG